MEISLSLSPSLETQEQKLDENYDLIIVGGGPAAFSAAIYAARYKIKTLIIAEEYGGTAAEAHEVCNYPGFKSINGFELMEKMQEQALSYPEVKLIADKVIDIKKNEEKNIFTIETDSGKKINSKKVILAIGTKRRKLGLEREDFFLGKGVSYCATCDAAFYKNKTVAVIGGGNSATTAALLLAEHADKVYIIYRRNKLKGERVWVDLVEKNPKIEVIYNTTITEFLGENKIEGVKLSTGEDLPLDGVFIEIGSEPDKEFLNKIGVKTNEQGYVIVNEYQETNIKGLFAAGDVVDNVLKQIITAAAEGAIAATFIYEQLSKEQN